MEPIEMPAGSSLMIQERETLKMKDGKPQPVDVSLNKASTALNWAKAFDQTLFTETDKNLLADTVKAFEKGIERVWVRVKAREAGTETVTAEEIRGKYADVPVVRERDASK